MASAASLAVWWTAPGGRTLGQLTWCRTSAVNLAPLVQLALALWLSARNGPVGAGIGALLLLLFTWLGNLLELGGHMLRLPQMELSPRVQETNQTL